MYRAWEHFGTKLCLRPCVDELYKMTCDKFSSLLSWKRAQVRDDPIQSNKDSGPPCTKQGLRRQRKDHHQPYSRRVIEILHEVALVAVEPVATWPSPISAGNSIISFSLCRSCFPRGDEDVMHELRWCEGANPARDGQVQSGLRTIPRP